MNDHEREQALEDAVRNAVATHAERTPTPVAAMSSRGQMPLAVAILLGWALIGYIWLAEPAFVFGPAAAAEIPLPEREARLRFGMYLQHQEIIAFTDDSGRLPHSLDELELDAVDGVRLEFDPQGAWALVGTNGELSLRLTESMSADSFLGTSLLILQDSR